MNVRIRRICVLPLSTFRYKYGRSTLHSAQIPRGAHARGILICQHSGKAQNQSLGASLLLQSLVSNQYAKKSRALRPTQALNACALLSLNGRRPRICSRTNNIPNAPTFSVREYLTVHISFFSTLHYRPTLCSIPSESQQHHEQGKKKNSSPRPPPDDHLVLASHPLTRL